MGFGDTHFVIVPVCYNRQFYQKSEPDYISLIYGDVPIFKMADVSHFEFLKFRILWQLAVITVRRILRHQTKFREIGKSVAELRPKTTFLQFGIRLSSWI